MTLKSYYFENNNSYMILDIDFSILRLFAYLDVCKLSSLSLSIIYLLNYVLGSVQ